MLFNFIRELLIFLLLLSQDSLQYFFLSFDIPHGHVLLSFFVHTLFFDLIDHLLFFLELSFQGDQDFIVFIFVYLHLFLKICYFLF